MKNPVRPGAVSELSSLVRIVREHGHRYLDIDSWSPARDVLILKAMLARGQNATEIELAIIGTRLLVEAGEVSWITPGEAFTMRALWKASIGVRPLFGLAVETALHETARVDRAAKPRKVKEDSQPERIAIEVDELIGGGL